MDIIYSRKRIRLPKFNKNNRNLNTNKNVQKVIKILIILCIAFTVVTSSMKAMLPIFEEQCIAKSKNITTLVSNNKATEVMRQYSYTDLVSIYKDDSGNVTMVKANTIPINEIISDVAVKIQEELNKEENTSFNIKLGSILGSRLFSR